MEILRILSEFLTKEYGGGAFGKILELLAKNNFDIKRTLSSLNPDTVAPIIKEFLNAAPAAKKETSSFNGKGFGVSPIENIADKHVIYTLNKHFGG